MGLNIKQSADNQGGASEYVKTTVLRDFPLVAIRPHRYGQRPGYQNKGTDDYVVADFVALNADGQVVLSKEKAMWSIKRREDGGPGALFRIFDTATTGYVLVGRVRQVPTKDGNTANVWDDVSPTPAQVATLEKAFSDMGDPAPAPAPAPAGWANSQAAAGTPPF